MSRPGFEEIESPSTAEAVKPTDSPLARVVGVQYRVLCFLYRLSKSSQVEMDRALGIEAIARALSLKKTTVRNALIRLQTKHCIIRKRGKRGRGGWTCFMLVSSLYEALMHQERVGSLEPLTHSETPQGCLNPRSKISVVCSNKLPKEWQAIDYSLLMEIGFNELHLEQLYKLRCLDALTIQNSIYHFAFDLKYNHKKAQIRGDVLNYFMGILSKRPYTAPGNYIHPDLDAMQIYLKTKEAEAAQQANLEIELKEVEFKSWYEQLSDQEIKTLTGNVTEGARLAPQMQQTLKVRCLRQYFTEMVWSERRREIIQSGVSWKNVPP